MDTEEILDPKEFFQIPTIHKRPYLFPDGKVLDLRKGVPENCVELYKNKFFYLKLKKGAEVLFNDLSEDEVLTMIKRTKSRSDVNILSKLITSKEGKAIVAEHRKTIL